MFEIISNAIKYIFVTAIYFFMFSIIRLIYLDIKQSRMGSIVDDNPYIKLVNRSNTLSFQVEEYYSVCDGLTLGRSPKADVAFPDPYLSSVHIIFKSEDGFWSVIDNNSTNGSYVNGERITNVPCAVKTGDLIKCGQLMFIFVEPIENVD